MGSIHSRRHFCLLAIAVVVLAFAVPSRPAGVVSSAGLYGSLHATLLVLCLRESVSAVRKSAFIASAGCLTMVSLSLVLEFSRLAAQLRFPGTLFLALGLVAGLGASGYGLLVREFRIVKLPFRAMAWLALGCVLATTIVFGVVPSAQARGGLWLVAAWWFAFSAGLLWYDTRIDASRSASATNWH